ncbi:MAG: hypothetical protein IKO61_10065 [Lachnospiraceae bacterium]|nr:hypothetical protein [Lachnospiraceae bacterium]
MRENALKGEELRKSFAEKLIVDILGIAVIVMAVILAVSIIGALVTDKKEKAAVKQNYYNSLDQSMEDYGRLHTDGGSYASVVYSEAYKEYASLDEAYESLCSDNDIQLLAAEQ